MQHKLDHCVSLSSLPFLTFPEFLECMGSEGTEMGKKAETRSEGDGTDPQASPNQRPNTCCFCWCCCCSCPCLSARKEEREETAGRPTEETKMETTVETIESNEERSGEWVELFLFKVSVLCLRATFRNSTELNKQSRLLPAHRFLIAHYFCVLNLNCEQCRELPRISRGHR
ncbi:regulator of G-protein signaling 17-like [Stegostoma tigrinum]|uniref:regulator of G-protein signaling 17-like n=1 Tax=Stegostoma tigrinum TaxID=3053191 RepID=UPI0028704460|nr:regulator of G-protein signaling 17-like [Stegostoma tigrinum]